jgi:magnesium-transporting ATPase (P-type)
MKAIFSETTLHQIVEAILITFTIDVALPRGLPLSVTLALAHTAKQLQKKHIFVKYLNES